MVKMKKESEESIRMSLTVVKLLIIAFFVGMGVLFLIGIVSAEANPCGSTNSFLGEFGQAEEITLKQVCDACTYVNISAVTYPNSSVEVINAEMTKSGIDYYYDFINTNDLGCYSYSVYGDKDGGFDTEVFDFKIGKGSLIFVILLFAFAIVFFLASLVTPEEFFVYISGVCFLILGVYLISTGIGIIDGIHTRNLGYISLGIGILFTVGAYIYNYGIKERDDEEY